jgi:predicted AAA+ superfamily ATPase
MISRPYWLNLIKEAWENRPLIWLSGVRRSGKTTLCKMIPDTVYLNCNLPSLARQLENPEYFYQNIQKDAKVIFDEITKL